MGYHHQPKSDREMTRKRRPEVAENEDWRGTEPDTALTRTPNGILKLQRMIGNQAVQRLIAEERAVVQREPDDMVAAPAGSGQGEEKHPHSEFFASITLAEQGKIQGESHAEGHEGQIEVLDFQLEMSSPSDTGAGKSPKAPGTLVKFTKELDKSTAILMQALAKNETVKTAQFEYIRHDEDGKAQSAQTFQFSNGKIISDRIISPNNLDPHSKTAPELESISIRFSSMEMDKGEKKK